MKKKAYAVVIFIYLFLSFMLITSGLYIVDALPEKLTYKISSYLPVSDITVSNNDIDISSGDTVSDEGTTVELPSDMKAIWLDMSKDISSSVSDGLNPFITEAVEYFNYFDNFLTNTIAIKPDINSAYSELKDSNGNYFDLLREYIARADLKDYFKILIIDDEMIFNSNGDLSFDVPKYYLSNYSFDGVVFSSDFLSENSALNLAVDFFHSAVKSFDVNLYFGTVIIPKKSDGYADAQSIEILNSGKTDFVFLKANGSLKSSSLPFATVMSWWNEFAEYYPSVSFYVLHRTDLVCQGSYEWNSYTEISDEMRYMWDYNNITGSVFYSASSMRSNASSFAQRIAYLLDAGQSDDLRVQKIALDSQNNTVTFTGTSLSGHNLICNGESAKKTGGSFNLKYALKAGSNTFSIFSCGKTQTYRIYNNTHLISSYYPQTDINAAKDEVVTVSAVCINSCSVVCSLNGRDYTMIIQENAQIEGMPEGFAVFSCGINFTNNSYMDLNLGNIVITASTGDNSEAVTCGRVTLLKSNTSPLLNKFLEFFYNTFYPDSKNNSQYTEISTKADGFSVTPYSDNGLGTALMCKIYYDDTEQLAPAGTYDLYQPDLSCLCEGTLDYVENITVSDGGYIRYELSSGISVYGVNCELINNAFVMPENKVSVKELNESTSSTDIVFNTDWLVPVTVKAYPQNYHSGYQSYAYNIYSFTAEYIDVAFNHTATFSNQSKLNFDASSPFSYSELYGGTNGELILRLYLKKQGQFYGFDIYTDENSCLVLSFKKHSSGDLTGKVIMLDPGHGGLAMTGTALKNESVAEAEVTLNIAKKVQKILTDAGATVIMTRTMDTPLELDERCEILSEYNPDIFVSIHCDGSDNTSDSGTHTFYFRSYSQPLASSINSALVSVYRNYIYKAGDANYSSINRGIKYYPFYVTRLNQCPSVLVETGFMTNLTEGNILIDDNCQYLLAQGIASGISDYFQKNNVNAAS